jgi:hypothetical protein
MDNDDDNESKRYRNRLNSQRTRVRERTQLDSMESERCRLYLSNTALQYHNEHLRDTIRRIREHSLRNETSRMSIPSQQAAARTTSYQPSQNQALQQTATAAGAASSLRRPQDLLQQSLQASSRPMHTGIAFQHQVTTNPALAGFYLGNDGNANAASTNALGSHHYPSPAVLLGGGTVTPSPPYMNQQDIVQQLLLNAAANPGAASTISQLAARQLLAQRLLHHHTTMDRSRGSLSPGGGGGGGSGDGNGNGDNTQPPYHKRKDS